ncbi:MAG: serine hydrolase [Candidatus Eremiobacteraeota bacterium]|nr:serine hydrolase [Candidatus Eremiobacteraeota bacterium]
MKRVAAIALVFLLFPAGAPAQSTPKAASIDDAIAAIAAYGPRALAEQGAPGMSVAITDRTHTLKILTFGYANVESKTPVTETTRFPVGSISKSMTSLALMQLHDRGLVDLNAPVQRYLPWWSINSGDGIVVHQLLSHTAGTPDDYTLDGSYGYQIAALRNAHTIFTPGTKWAYSNDGFATVGAVAAAVSRRSWQDGIQSTVFAPLGMTHSSAYFDARTMADTATGYIFRDADLVATPPHPALVPAQVVDFVNPAGSVISTPGDMAAYMRFYLNDGTAGDGARLLRPSTFTAMTTPDHLTNGKPAGAASPELAEWPEFYRRYGYGLAVFDTNGDHLVGHTGGINGYTACMQMNLTRGFGVIAMSNLIEAPLHPCAIVKYAMAVLRAQQLGTALPPAPTALPIAPPAIVASQYAGTYRGPAGATVVVRDNNGTPQLLDGATAYTLDPRGDDLFWTNDPRFPNYYVAFTRNSSKLVDGFTHGSSLYANERYAGPSSFSYPPGWNSLTGRYEANIWGTLMVMRIVVVKNKLTVDGVTPLGPKNGAFMLGASDVRFDTNAGGKTQRVWLDGQPLYRIDLP